MPRRIRTYTICAFCRKEMTRRAGLFCGGACQRAKLVERIALSGCMRCHCKNPPDGFATTGYCLPCNRLMKRAAYQRWTPEQKRAKQKHDAEHPVPRVRSRIKLRLEVLAHYGGKCACCGEGRYEFMAIDHIHGGGGAHRRMINGSLERWLKKNNWPDGFRVLCHNCNHALGRYGYCPHKDH